MSPRRPRRRGELGRRGRGLGPPRDDDDLARTGRRERVDGRARRAAGTHDHAAGAVEAVVRRARDRVEQPGAVGRRRPDRAARCADEAVARPEPLDDRGALVAVRDHGRLERHRDAQSEDAEFAHDASTSAAASRAGAERHGDRVDAERVEGRGVQRR